MNELWDNEVALEALPVMLEAFGLPLPGESAVIAAAVTTTLVRGAGPVRGTVLSLNGAAQSVGVFAGASLAGGALALGGWTGVGLVLGGATALAAVFARRALRGARTAEAVG